MYLIFLKCCDIMYEYLGVWLSWESACFACKRSGVRIPSSPPVGKPDSIKSSIVKSGFFILVSSLNSHFILAAIRKNCAFFFLAWRQWDLNPLGLGASRRIPSSPPVGKPDSIKSSIVKSGFLLFLHLKNLFYSTQTDKNPHCSRKWLK